MIYREVAPGPRLSPSVKCFWFLRCGPGSGPQPIVPDGSVEIVFHLASPFAELRAGGLVRQPASLVVGQMRGPMHVAPTGRGEAVGVRFRPAGARVFLGVPLGELTGRVWDLETVAPALARDLPSRLAAVASDGHRCGVLESRLLRHARSPHAAAPRIVAAAEALQREAGLSVDALAHRLGTSARQLERGFARDVGVGPRFLARLLRFQRALRALDRPNDAGGWAAVAARCGYADQSHLIRDFRAFTGEPPERFRAAGHDLAESFAGLRENH